MALPRIFRALFAQPDGATATPASPPDPPVAARVADNAELEAAIAANLDDPGPWLVYADWLQSQGDPRGEFIAVQYTIAQTTDPDHLVRLRGIERQMRDDWADHLLGSRSADARYEWQFGHVITARLSAQWDDQTAPVAERTAALLKHPSGRFLRDLTIGMTDDHSHQPVIDALVAAGPLPNLRSLFLGDFVLGEEADISSVDLGDLEPLWASLPNLESLILQGGMFELGDIVAPNLAHLEIRTGGMSSSAITSLDSATLPAAETLILWTGSGDYGAEVEIEDISRILAGRGLPKVTHLGVMNCHFADVLCLALAESAILPRLRTLDLSLGTLSDVGGQVILSHIGRFRHLERLELRHQYLDGTRAPLARHAFVHLGPQRRADPGDRYVSVSE